MVRGHGELLAVKSEKDGDDELAQKIKDGLCPDTFQSLLFINLEWWYKDRWMNVNG